jgi:hypothetical protein
MSQTKRVAVKKTNLTIRGDLSRLGESLNLKRLPYVGLLLLVV